MRRTDPRIRQTLNQASQTLESISQTTQANLFSFTESYLTPCLSSLNNCLEASCHPCFQCAQKAARSGGRGRGGGRGARGRGYTRGRPELSFDFYDDWDEDELNEEGGGSGGGLMGGWGNDELDRLLAGSGAHGGNEQQPLGGTRIMNYGSSRGKPGRRRSLVVTKDGVVGDPTIVPSSNMFGFWDRLSSWGIGSGGGGKAVRYRPSAADLQEHPGRRGKDADQGEEASALLEESGEEEEDLESGHLAKSKKGHGRKRSGTSNSRSTTNSLSSRGDLFPSEDEDDAIPLDDEFSMALERRTTGSGPMSDDMSSGRTKRSKRPSTSTSRRISARTASSKDTRSTESKPRDSSSSSGKSKTPAMVETSEIDQLPSLDDLKQEEERVRVEEKAEVENKRLAAQKLALERGLNGNDNDDDDDEDDSPSSREFDHIDTTDDSKPHDYVELDDPPLSTQASKQDERPPDPRSDTTN